MSIEGIQAAFASRNASPTQKAVMVVLGNYADQDHECSPSMAAIMACTAFPQRTVAAALEALEERGLIERRHRFDSTGQAIAPVYFLAFVAEHPNTIAFLTSRGRKA